MAQKVSQIMMYVCGVQFYLPCTDLKDAIELAVFFGSIPEKCPECQSEVQFRHYTTKSKHTYWGLECGGSPKHQTIFHWQKDENGGDAYLKDGEKWTAYTPGSAELDPENSTSVATMTQDQRAAVGKTLVDTVKQQGVAPDMFWRVGAFVVKIVAKKPVCDCKTYEQNIAADPEFVCEHIYAVKEFFELRKAQTAATTA